MFVVVAAVVAAVVVVVAVPLLQIVNNCLFVVAAVVAVAVANLSNLVAVDNNSICQLPKKQLPTALRLATVGNSWHWQIVSTTPASGTTTANCPKNNCQLHFEWSQQPSTAHTQLPKKAKQLLKCSQAAKPFALCKAASAN